MSFQYDLNFVDLTLDGELLLLFDWSSDDGSKRFSIFTKNSLFKQFCDSELLVFDGTFKTCPSPFKQLFIAHGNVPGYDEYFTYPLVWIFMSGKDQNLYVNVFDILREHALESGSEIKAKYFICDFEAAIRNALRIIFPSINSSGCFFHLRQIVLNQLRKMKLFESYKCDANFSFEINLMIALSFFPPNEIQILFPQIYSTLSQNATRFADWFQSGYVKKPDGRDARTPPEFWSIYELVRQGLPKTQCGAEQSHHSLFLSCNKEHNLGVYKILSVLKEQMIKSDQNLERLQSGLKVRHRNKYYEAKETLIQSILDKKEEPNRSLLETLRAITTTLCNMTYQDVPD